MPAHCQSSSCWQGLIASVRPGMTVIVRLVAMAAWLRITRSKSDNVMSPVMPKGARTSVPKSATLAPDEMDKGQVVGALRTVTESASTSPVAPLSVNVSVAMSSGVVLMADAEATLPIETVPMPVTASAPPASA